MIFVETPLFTRRVRELLDDDQYIRLQHALAAYPDAGDLIEGTGGLRKVRVGASGRGKRGGARVIYYYFAQRARIAMLLIYAKNERDDLSPDQRATLRKIVEHWNQPP
ncbi:type II toxin-antitoxin system RelE/ParE family toxin [Luteibacter aegosomaticola]|uniref:type II toxin-antitoxin system RelE/ParE family toxin n=1 Tax=Luteibacter aegosomaticola TaxID=2911538 RepID=UPI001FF89B18|nr:type II toxin-antitoxin system RelE/ParE family toxin [Luteibacter aegosomaticola]UPG89698.1 type II toxin-antitoxin system RelE/ParE family toxin [Luteibacter aegosomaticola]